MDIISKDKTVFTTKIFNNQSIGYTFYFLISAFVFLLSKQLLKLIFGISAPIAVFIGFVLFEVVLFIFEKKKVFNNENSDKKKKALEIPMYLFRCFVDFGFFKIFDFIFIDILKLDKPLVFLMTGVMLFFFNYYFDSLIVFSSSYRKNQRPNRLYNLFFSTRFVLASVIAAACCILFVFCAFNLFPFGDMTVMRMDLYHQYGPLFAEFYDRIIEHKSFLYSWQAGGGSSFLGNYFNYLSSPLSFIIFLFDRKQIAFAITTLVMVKGILAAATFTYYLKKSLNAHSYITAAFGVFYAFSGYFLAYYWNIMWIDGMILLPLIALGIEKIINYGKPLLYIASLVLLLFSSYYMGYMCCIFSVVYFFAYYFMKHGLLDKVDNNAEFNNKYSLRKLYNNLFINKCVKFGVSSLLCGGLCACFLLPVYSVLQSCSATSDSFPSTLELYFDMLNMLSSHLAGLETTIRSSGEDVLPNIYCGMLTALLIPLYYVNKKIGLREKSIYTLILIFLVLSFNTNFANFVWHAFHFPNDLPYRFSYMYCFIVLIMAYKAFSKLSSLRYQDIAFTGILWSLIILLFQKHATNKISDFTIYLSLICVVFWTGTLLLIYRKKLQKVYIGIAVLALVFCETIVGDCHSYVFTQEQKNYVSNYDSYTEAIDYTYKKDKDFYRTELCTLDTLMDPSLYGYNGVSAFSSMAYEDYSQDQFSLGLGGNRINSYSYDTQTPVYNMMFGIKYLMCKDKNVTPSSDFYSEYYTTKDGETTVFENKYYLPIAFETSNDVNDWDVEEGNPFDVQSDFIYKATGIADVFVPVEYTDTAADSITCDEVTENGTYFFSKPDSASETDTVDVTLKATTDSNVYVYVTSPEVKNINFYWNNDENSENQNIEEPYILDLGKHNIGDEIKLSLDCGAIEGTSSYFEIYAYSINKDAFASAYELLKQGPLQIDEYSDTKINGTIDAGYDGYIYTSIPYDEGWHVYIDGSETETFVVANSMMAVPVKHGTHNITMKYSPKSIKLGLAVTAGTWLLTAAGFLLKKFLNKNDKQKFV